MSSNSRLANGLKLVVLAFAHAALSVSVAAAAPAVTTVSAQVFSAPLKTAPVVGTVRSGAKVDLLWCGDGPQWCLITYRKMEGFIGAAAVQLLSANGQLVTIGLGGSGYPGKDGLLMATDPGHPVTVLTAQDGGHTVSLPPQQAHDHHQLVHLGLGGIHFH